MQIVAADNPANKPGLKLAFSWLPPNAKVSDGSQPPLALNLSLSDSAGSRSLHRLVRWFSGN